MKTELLLLVSLLSTIITSIMIIFLISYQKRRHLGQVIRELGPRTHLVKQGTPTLGGIAFILATAGIFSIFFWCFDQESWQKEVYILAMIPFLGYGILGFIDDYLIMKRGKNDGISSGLKFFLQICLAGIYFFLYLRFGYSTEINFVLFQIDFKWVYGIFILLVFTGFSNATNLTDGLDGLLGGLMLIATFSLYLIAHWMQETTVQSLIVILMGALFGFLLFNYPKAKIIMGNVGSLALGGLFTSVCILLKIELLIFMIGGVFLLETLSVMLQVGYFKLSKGKRIFRMAPLHHHFELKPMKEKSVMYLFYILGFVCSILGILVYFFCLRGTI